MQRFLLCVATLLPALASTAAAQAPDSAQDAGTWVLPRVGWFPGTVVGMVGLEYDRMVGGLMAGGLVQGGYGSIALASLLYGDRGERTLFAFGATAGYRYYDADDQEWVAGLRVVVDLLPLRFDVAIFPTVEQGDGEMLLGVGYVLPQSSSELRLRERRFRPVFVTPCQKGENMRSGVNRR